MADGLVYACATIEPSGTGRVDDVQDRAATALLDAALAELDSWLASHGDELIALAEAYRDRVRRAVRVDHPTPQGTYFTYALVIDLDSARWVPYCSRSTTDFSGEGGAGHRRVEEALRRLGIPVTSVPCPVEGEEAALLEKTCCDDAIA